ncbi:MAG: long-chain fatty acid--CoA ligase [Chloroflexi bacterium]|nr:long-chain fatty acid--CoA ligase [Chloroflexota bacterium]
MPGVCGEQSCRVEADVAQPWLSFYPQGIPRSLAYPAGPLYAFLQGAAARCPDRPAIIYYRDEALGNPQFLSYRALDEASDRLAAALLAMGVQPGERVAYFLPNSPELVVTYYGVLKAGAVVVPCNPMYRERELAGQLADAGARVLVTAEELWPVAQVAVDGVPGLQTILVGGPARPGVLSWDELLAQHSPLRQRPAIRPGEDLASLMYTGGTTGPSKGAMLTHANLVANTVQFRTWYGCREAQEVFIAALPLSHIGGIMGAMNVPVAAAATLVLFRRFHPRTVLAAIQQHRATRFPGVPTMYLGILAQEGAASYDLSSLGPSRTGAAPLPVSVKRRFDELVGHEVLIEAYGLTETSSVTHANPLQRAKAGSIGVPLPDTEARIVDPDGGARELPPGEVGELVLRGVQVMRGYWRRPEETAKTLRDGWLYTGDLASMDHEGYFYIVDRKKDVINAAGFKVWPREVEEVLYRHPAVQMAAVIGVPDAYRGETVKAVLVLKGDMRHLPHDGLKRELEAFCRAELAAYKVPRIIEFREALPVSGAGKVLRRALREEASLESSD